MMIACWVHINIMVTVYAMICYDTVDGCKILHQLIGG